MNDEGLWISPTGERIIVIEHLIALQQYPHIFGLTRREVSGSIKTLRDVAVGLIRSGWIRFRDFGTEYVFEIGAVSPMNLRTIEDILMERKVAVNEEVKISILKPKAEYSGTVAELFDRKMFKYYQNPRRNKWRLS